LRKRIIFDVGHPAQVHNFKFVYWDLNNKGWDGLFTAKDKEVTITLLENYNLPYVILGKSGSNLFNKVIILFFDVVKYLRILNRYKPDIVVCRFSPHATFCSFLMGIPAIGLADTEHTKLLDHFTVPLTRAKITAKSYERSLGKNHIRFDANIELFYLHPNRYNFPDKKYSALDLSEGQEYVLLRFVAWHAHHDIGERGLSVIEKINLLELLKKKYKIFISAEGALPRELESYRIKIPPEGMHDVIAYASLYIGEGASMASEAACLGVTSVYINSLDAGSIKEEAKYGLLYNLRNSKDLMGVVTMLMNDDRIRLKTKNNLKRFLKGKIDPTSFLVWFIENWPESLAIMKEDPKYQEKFR